MSFGGVFEGHFGSSEGEGAAGGGIVTINGSGAPNQTLVGTAGQIGVSSVAGVTTFTNLGVLTFRKVGGGSFQNVSIKALNGLTIADIGTGEFDFSQVLTAQWATGLTGIFAVDEVNGNDASAGFAVPLNNTAGAYATACALAGSQALKTFAGLAAIFPRYGAGRDVEIVLANGGANTEGSYNAGLQTFLGGCCGYNSISIRGTGTNTTAGCVAFDGSTADVTYQGGITVPGLNVPGYNPNGATTTSLPCLKVGGGAATLPAEPAAPLGWRVRFDAATATAGLRNQCRQIAQVTGGTTIVPLTAFSNAPGNTDVFYIEQAGVVHLNSLVAFPPGGNGANTSPTNYNMGGLRDSGTFRLVGMTGRVVFCGCNSLIANAPASLVTSQTYTHPVLGSIIIGGGLRAETSVTDSNSLTANFQGLIAAGAGFSPTFIENMLWAVGCYCNTTLTWANCTGPLGQDNGTAPQIGSATAQGSPRINGQLLAIGVRGQIGGCTIAGAGALPAIALRGSCGISFSQGVCAGTTGNNDVGLDLSNSRNSLIVIVVTPTITGALGDVRLGGGQIMSWASLAATGITDSNGNRIIGLGAAPSGYIPFSGAIAGGAGATISYLANGGIVGAVNQTTAFKRPTSNRLMTRLKVAPQSNTSANTVTVTLYKNGAPTAMQVSIPTGSVAQFTDSAHPILFLDGDQFDLRIDDAADVGALVTMSACLEYTV